MLIPFKTLTLERLYFDGFGAQYLTVIASIAYCDHMKYNYFHSPFTEVQHCLSPRGNLVNDTVTRARAEELSRFIGIPSGMLFSTFRHTCLKVVTVHKSEKHWARHGKIYKLVNGAPNKYYNPHVLSILRQYYYSTPKPNTKTSIALHIRRGDVDKKTHPTRYTDNDKYKKIIRFLLKTYPNDTITIFSEGIIDDFHDLQQNRVVFQLNGTVEETFHSFVKAKVLVIAKSLFSYCAALLNKNEIYYIPYLHLPLKHWKTIIEDPDTPGQMLTPNIVLGI
jgi:hypothetical protein